ncbi:MAG: type III-B CRISPR-associated protein Cas10/Cmr2, partial [Bacteroidales bacterium]
MAVPWKKDNEDIKLNDLKNFIEESEIERWEKLWQFAEKNGEFPPNIGFLYQLIYTSLEKSIGARKNLRNFRQSEELEKKCSICGEKEAIVQSGMGNLEIGKFISDKEKLCITCFVKRGLEKYLSQKFGEPFKDFSFPSNAEVASSDFKEKAIKEAKDELKNYIAKFKQFTEDKFPKVDSLPRLKKLFEDIENLEGEWFYENNLNERSFEKNLGVKLDKKKIEELKESLRRLTQKIGKPNSYYAVIMLDADDMGKWLSSDNLPSIEYAYNSEVWEKLPKDFKNELKKLSSKKLLTPAIHASISNALRNYSLEFVIKIVEEEHLGKLVYAGGDDVLAFVNLKDLFEVMKKLRAAFSGHIKINDGNIEVDWQNNIGFVEKDGKYFLTMGPKASASCGVVIANYKMPLKLVIDKVRETEKKAKNISDKDAFAIALIKRSGQIREFACKWRFDKDTEKIDTIEKMREIGEFFTGKDGVKLSKKFTQKIHNEFVRLKDKEGRFS